MLSSRYGPCLQSIGSGITASRKAITGGFARMADWTSQRISSIQTKTLCPETTVPLAIDGEAVLADRWPDVIETANQLLEHGVKTIAVCCPGSALRIFELHVA